MIALLEESRSYGMMDLIYMIRITPDGGKHRA